MELNEDLVAKIISLLPLKKLIQCKTLNKRVNHLISDPNFVQTHVLPVPPPDFIFYTSKMFKKISPYQLVSTSRFSFYTKIIFPIEVSPILDSCNGLLLLDFSESNIFCVFNPVTRMNQLIPAPTNLGTRLAAGLASDYPTSHQYKVVIVQTSGEEKGYKFHMCSSQDSAGVWQEFQLTTDLGNFANFIRKPAYLDGTLNWLMDDGSVLAFDTNKKCPRIFNNSYEVIKLLHGDPPNGDYIKTIIGLHTWLGVAKGKLHLVCACKRYIVVVAYDDTIDNWEIVHFTDNFSPGLDLAYERTGRPLWFDNKRVLFPGHTMWEAALYEYDFETRKYRMIVAVPNQFFDSRSFFPFVPTLATVRNTLPDSVPDYISTKISSALDRLRQLF